MKSKFLALLFVLAVSLPARPSRQETALINFYARHYPQIQSEYLREIVQGTEKYAAKLCLSGEVDTLLSMAHRESHFEMYSDDGLGVRRSLGFYQTREQYRGWLRTYWLARGVKLGPDDSVDTQCAFGVAEFRVHVNRAGGNIWGGVRRYNGSGPAAQDYARKVFISRRKIFGRTHFAGESIKVECGRIHAK